MIALWTRCVRVSLYCLLVPICLMTGCVFPWTSHAEVKVFVEESPTNSQFRPAEGTSVPGGEMVVVRFYKNAAHDEEGWYSGLGVEVLRKQGQVVVYPLHTYAVYFLGETGTDWPFQGLMVFSDNCWPAMVCTYMSSYIETTTGPSKHTFSEFARRDKSNKDLQPVAHEEARVALIPRSQKVDYKELTVTAGLERANPFETDKTRAKFFNDVINTTAGSWSLNDRQRLMVYRSLLDLLEETGKNDAAVRALYQPHCERLRKLIEKLQPK
jgi:hypothetical protein